MSSSRSPGTPTATGAPSIFTRTFFSVCRGRRCRGAPPATRSSGCPGCGPPASAGRCGAVAARRREGDRLDVRRVAAIRAGDERVLADRGRREELLRCRAAHRAGDRRDDPVVQAEPVEDADVGLAVQLVGLGEPRVVDVERVGVLHDEFAAAQDPERGRASSRYLVATWYSITGRSLYELYSPFTRSVKSSSWVGPSR